MIHCKFDGGSLGNGNSTAKAGIGFEIYHAETKMHLVRVSRFIGNKTNNIAEYTAVIECLEKLIELDLDKEDIVVMGDSELVIKQLNGIYRCKAEHLKTLNERAKYLLRSFKNIKLEWIPREQNNIADGLSKKGAGGADTESYNKEYINQIIENRGIDREGEVVDGVYVWNEEVPDGLGEVNTNSSTNSNTISNIDSNNISNIDSNNISNIDSFIKSIFDESMIKQKEEIAKKYKDSIEKVHENKELNEGDKKELSIIIKDKNHKHIIMSTLKKNNIEIIVPKGARKTHIHFMATPKMYTVIIKEIEIHTMLLGMMFEIVTKKYTKEFIQN